MKDRRLRVMIFDENDLLIADVDEHVKGIPSAEKQREIGYRIMRRKKGFRFETSMWPHVYDANGEEVHD